MAGGGRASARGHLDSVDTYIEIEKYFYRHGARPRKCECLRFWDLLDRLPARSGYMAKSNSRFSPGNMVKVDIFSWSRVEALVRGMGASLVGSILDCKCTACRGVLGLKHIPVIERKEKVISDMQLCCDKGVPPTGNDHPSDSSSKAVLFAMLCYLGTPFMIYFDIWEHSSRDLGVFGLMKFCLDEDQVFECFGSLYEPQKMAGGGFSGSTNPKFPVINEQTNKFIQAFQQVERQFQPLQLSPRIQSLTVPYDAVFPFHDFEYRQHGGQAEIYTTRVLGEFREGFKNGHSIDVQSHY